MGEGQIMLLSSIIKTFGTEFLAQYAGQLLPSHRKALAAMEICRTRQSPKMLVGCDACERQTYVPHSRGHRSDVHRRYRPSHQDPDQ